MVELKSRTTPRNVLKVIQERENVIIWGSVIGLTLVGFGLRLYRLDAIPAVWDEVFNYNVARQDFGAIFNSVANAIEPPLYYLLLHFWASLSGGGNSEFNVRILSVVLGTAIIPASYWFFTRLVNRWWALVGAAMVTANGYHLYYSQYAKNYIEVTLLSFISLALFLDILAGKGLEDKAKAPFWNSNLLRWVGWTVTNTLIAYTHYFSAYVVIGEYLVLGLFVLLGKVPRLRTLLYVAGTAVGGLILYAPWLGRALNSLSERVSDPGWLYYKLDLEFFLRQVAGLPNLFLGLEVTNNWLYGMIGLLVVGTAGAIFATYRMRRVAPTSAKSGDNTLPAVGLLLPAIVLPYLAVMIYTSSQLETRNFLGGLGALIYVLILLIGQKLWQWKLWLGVGVVLVLVLLTAFSARHYYRWGTHGDDYRVMVQQIRQLQHNGQNPALMIPMQPVEDVLRFYMREDELSGMLKYPKPLKDYRVPTGGLIVVLDIRFADLDWSIKELIGHLQTYSIQAEHYIYPGCQVFLFLPKT